MNPIRLIAIVSAVTGIALSPLVPVTARAEQPRINTLSGGFFETRTDTAILGYDPVSYFTSGRAEKGTDAFVLSWNGARWKFVSQQHLDLFKADPEKYAPQYGGYCAFGVANGNLVSIEPSKFRIVDGKLYLNYDASVQTKWLQDVPGYIRKADSLFPGLLTK